MTTRYLQLSQPHATGVVLTDTTLRFVALSQHHGSAIPGQYAELMVPDGCIKNGKVVSKARLVTFLKTMRKTYKVEKVNLVLNSEQIQTFSLSLKTIATMQVKEAVEKLFALPAKDIIYDYKAVGGNSSTTVLQVTVLGKKVSEEFVSAFKQAGITVLSIESIGHAVTRAILPSEFRGTTLVIAIDTNTTSLSYVVNGRVSETLMLEFGDVDVTKSIVNGLSVSAEEAEKLKVQQGLIARNSREVFDAVVDDYAQLVKHINDSYVTWKNEHPALPPLEAVYLTGAGSVVKGLDEYIASGLRLHVNIGNVWTNCLSFDEHIPAMPKNIAAGYGAAIGTALVGTHMVNLIPHSYQRSLHRRHVARRSGKVLLSFVFGVLVGVAVTRLIAIPEVHSKIFEVLHKIPTQW